MFGLSLHLSSQAKNDKNVELSESNSNVFCCGFFFPLWDVCCYFIRFGNDGQNLLQIIRYYILKQVSVIPPQHC